MKAKFVLLLKSARVNSAIKLACLAAPLSLLAVGCSTPKSFSSADNISNSGSPRTQKSSTAAARTVLQIPDAPYSMWGIPMHPCYIVKTKTVSADSTIKVYVGGEVAHPGAIEVPEGTTVLEAIVAAGGFCEFSAIYHIHLVMGDRRYSPKLHVHKTAFHTRQAWYGDGEGDFVLEPEASIYVPRRVSMY
jgi:hypothetical protein